jgi:putative endonuclease
MAYYVYILSNEAGSVLYTGVTGDLVARVYQHRHKLADGFTKRYNVTRLVYYEDCDEAMGAIEREKAIKGGSRKRKLDLIASLNPEWRDLYDELSEHRDCFASSMARNDIGLRHRHVA